MMSGCREPFRAGPACRQKARSLHPDARASLSDLELNDLHSEFAQVVAAYKVRRTMSVHLQVKVYAPQ